MEERTNHYCLRSAYLGEVRVFLVRLMAALFVGWENGSRCVDGWEGLDAGTSVALTRVSFGDPLMIQTVVRTTEEATCKSYGSQVLTFRHSVTFCRTRPQSSAGF